MDNGIEITPGQVARDPRIRVVDIRPMAERLGEVGYIPGSRSVTEEAIRRDGAEALRAYRPTDVLALVCLTGRRSEVLVPGVRALGFHRAYTVIGGVLSWRALGQPVCWACPEPEPGVEVELEAVEGLGELPRAMLSCFVAESVENALDLGLEDDFDPVGTLRALFAAEQVSWERPTPRGLMRVIDALAELARARGHSLERVAANVSRMSATLMHLTSMTPSVDARAAEGHPRRLRRPAK